MTDPLHLPLPLSLLRTLLRRPADRPAVLLVRHAPRGPIWEKGGVGMERDLTAEGVARAELLGREFLAGALGRSWSSPIFRCRNTVRAVSRGAGEEQEPEVEEILGEPGLFVHDVAAAGALLETLGTREVVLRLSAGEALPGLRSRDEGTDRLRELVIRRMPAAPVVNLLVSHDAIVIPFLHRFTGGAYDPHRWLAPLDGGLVVREPEGLRLWWNGRSFPLAGG